MKIGILLIPHANQRYLESLKKLALAELTILLEKEAANEIQLESISGLEMITFDLENPSDAVIPKLLTHSALFALFKIKGNQLTPLMDDYKFYFNDDISGILKYKGKTNEMFTEMLVNIGIFSSDFAGAYDQPLHLLDPMCGKATTLFKGLKKGYHTAGIELNKLFYPEVESFIKKYLQLNKTKHNFSKTSYKLPKNNRANKFILELADTPEHYKAGNLRTLQYVCGDTRYAEDYFGKKKFHSIITDLPYGVQHQGMAENKNIDLLTLLDEALDSWINTLRTGGTIVMAYNSQTLKTSQLKDLFFAHGLEIIEAAPFNDFSHWVEQAITRDIIIGKRTNLQKIEAF